jgi:hypothetical protein
MQAVVVEAPETLIGSTVRCRIVDLAAHSLHGVVAALDGESGDATGTERICA